MPVHQIVLDTNVLVVALRSREGASFRLLSRIGQEKFQINLSVPLVLEYEDVAKRLIGEIALDENELDDVIDYLCSQANNWQIFFLWRPFLKDPNDDMLLELAVTANCETIVTFNKNYFKGIDIFGIEALTPREFLERIGEL